MRVICYMTGTRREARLAKALISGFQRHAITPEVVRTKDTVGPHEGYDLAVFVGVRNKSRQILAGARSIGQQTLMLDKGYFQRDRYHRFSIGTPQPTYVSEIECSGKRFNILYKRSRLEKRKPSSQYVVYVESTQKYYSFHGLGQVEEYTARVVADLRVLAEKVGLCVMHRPRADRKSQVCVPAGAVLADPRTPITAVYDRAHCVVVHGSNAGVEAMLAGIPVISLASLAENPIHDLVNQGLGPLDALKVPSESDVLKRCSQLAWCQFNRAEIASGFAWDHTKQWVNR